MEQLLPTAGPSQRKGLTIGFLTTAIGEGTGRMLWSGVHEQCANNGAALVTFAGSELLNPDGFLRQANLVFELVDRKELDGLVVWASSMATYIGSEAAQQYCERFRPLPMVGIGIPMPGIPSIVLDSYQGMRDALIHLVREHGKRRIAFLRGPDRHREAFLRYQAYRDVVKEFQLDDDPALVTPPQDWSLSWGSSAMRLLTEERKVAFDSVACVNDGLAVGAMEYLQAHGVSIPGDVAIIGFDNTPEGRLFTPPLTTVPIRMRERGRTAVRTLLALIRGEKVPELVTLSTSLLARQSCGCPDPLLVEGVTGAATAEPGRTNAVTLDSARMADQRAAILDDLNSTIELEEAVPGWAATLLDSFLQKDQEGPSSFLATLRGLLHQSAILGGDLSAWRKIISTLREKALPLAGASAVEAERADWNLNQARIMVGETAQREQGYQDWKSKRQLNYLHYIRQEVSGAQNLQELVELLARELPVFGVQRCVMGLYLDTSNPLAGAQLVLGFDENLNRNPAEGRIFKGAGRIMSAWPESSEPKNVMVYPLYFRDEPLGFIMLDASTVQGTLHQILCEQISSALKSVLLIEQNVKLYHQAREAQRVAEEANLLKSRFLSIVSHELLTPIVLLVGLSEMILREGLGNRPALPDMYRQDLTRIHASAQQLGSLVRDVLDLARSQLGQLKLALRPMDLDEVLKPVVLVGEQLARSKGLTWRTSLPDHPLRIHGDAARLQQVALNLISNAIKFTTQGELALVVEEHESKVRIAISDTGVGVPSAEQMAIFDEFRQSERTVARGYGGMGIGLAICRQIVELHDGHIGVESSGDENGGSTFYFVLPLMQDEFPVTAEHPSQAVLVLTSRAAQAEHISVHLRREGYQVEILGIDETPGWLRAVLAAPPGAVVLDLPASQQGWELLEIFKNNPSTQDIPIIFYSMLDGKRESGESQVGGSMLTFDYLAKPVAASSLSQILQRYGLSGSQNSQQACVLLADDDPEILNMHARLVTEHIPGCRILTAPNGKIAMQIMRETVPGMVLLDLMMPELDGAGVIREMQDDSRLRDVPVIVLTSQTLTQAEMSNLNRGVTAVLSKGVYTPQETLAHIDLALKRDKRLGTENQRLVRRVMALMHEKYAEPLSREMLAEYAGVSERHLSRCFLQETGLSPMAYLNRLRLQQARCLLKDRNVSITEVMGKVGFSDSSHFTHAFRREAGVTPSEFQRGKRGAR